MLVSTNNSQGKKIRESLKYKKTNSDILFKIIKSKNNEN